MALEDRLPVDAIYDLGIAHNKMGVALPDGTPYPEHATDLTGARANEFLTHFNRVRDRDWAECSFLDLGCSEGSTTLELSQMGSTVYGVEGREDGVRRAQTLKSILGFNRTHFSVGNVDHASSYREVDGIFNAGILYHLEDPVTCLERCADNARSFIYLDTGHAPRTAEEMAKSKFGPKFGKSYKIDYKGLELDAIDFAEPGNTAEKQADGIRRGPRSGIGNSNSVWLTHDSAIALMRALGFPYHETVKNMPKFPRLRTAFFRTAPKPAQSIGSFLKPLPELLPMEKAIETIRRRDIAFMRRDSRPVSLIGREPMLSSIEGELRDAGIAIGDRIVMPGDTGPVSRGVINELTKGMSGLIVVSTPDVTQTIRDLGIVDRFDYAFVSFAMARA